MFVLGLVLIVAAVLLTVAVLTSNTEAVDTDLWGLEISNLSLGVIFVVGMLTTVAGLIGVGLLVGGTRRAGRLRRERRDLRRENERLAHQADQGQPGGVPPDETSAEGRHAAAEAPPAEPSPPSHQRGAAAREGERGHRERSSHTP